jgi:hypothetical protein
MIPIIKAVDMTQEDIDDAWDNYCNEVVEPSLNDIEGFELYLKSVLKKRMPITTTASRPSFAITRKD